MRTGAPLAAALAVLLTLAGTALADHPAGDPAGAVASEAILGARAAAVAPPSNQVRPEVSGKLREGEVVLALPGLWRGEEPLRFANRWERCDARRCSSTGTTGFLTQLVAADVGKRMRAVVTGSNDAGAVTVLSPQSATVRPRLQRMNPFPVVALRGYITRRGIFVSRLAARAPAGSKLRVTCRGRACPFRRASARFRRGVVAVRRMHRRTLPTGTVFSLRITQGENRVGKYTRFRVRRGRRPARLDRCLVPDERSPSRCEPPE